MIVLRPVPGVNQECVVLLWFGKVSKSSSTAFARPTKRFLLCGVGSCLERSVLYRSRCGVYA